MAKYEDKKTVRCSFCGKAQENVKRIIAGPGVYICDECVGLCSNIIEEEFEEMCTEEKAQENQSLSPKEIKEKLDEYVIGQDEAKIARRKTQQSYNQMKAFFKHTLE